MADFPSVVMRSLECPICQLRLTQPKLLACSHTFCEECLVSFLSLQARRDSIPCPVCRQVTAVGTGGVSKLQTNFPLKGVLSEINAFEAEDVTRTTRIGKWSHNMRGDATAISNEQQATLCPEHRAGEEERQCTDVCIKCKKSLCVRCATNHLEKGHEVPTADEYEEFCSRGADSLRVRAEAKIANVVKQNELIEAEKRKIVNHIDSLGRNINTTYNDMIKRLNEDKLSLDEKCKAEKAALCRKLDEMTIRNERIIERLLSGTSLVSNSNQAPLEVNTVAIRAALCEQLTQVLGEGGPSTASVLEVSGRAGMLEYNDIPESTGLTLGQVRYRMWKSTADVALSTADIMDCMAATPDGRMAVGCGKEERGIEIYSADGQLQQRVLSGWNVRAIGFLSDGRCAVRDVGNTSKHLLNVSLYTQGWEAVDTRFETLSLDEGGPGDLTVDSEDHIYVGYRKAKKIQVFSPAGGSAIREIACDGYVSGQIFAMKTSKMLMVNTHANISCTMDPSGDHLIERKWITKSGGCFVFPAVCKDDTVLIATVNKERDRVTIERYTSELQHMATLITDHVIQKTERVWYNIQEFTSGKIAFCTTDRLYIFSNSPTRSVFT